MRLAVVGPAHPLRGGIAHYTTLLSQALGQRHEVKLFSLSRQYPGFFFPGTSQLDESGDSIRHDSDRCLDSVNPWTWLTTARRIRRFRPDLILFSWWHPFFAPSYGTVARLCGWFGGAPSGYICHNVIPHERSRVDRLLLRYAFSSARVFVTHSLSDRDDLLALRPGAAVRHNPHPTYDVFAAGSVPSREEARRQLGLGDRRVLLFFGFVREYKGLEFLLEALERLEDDGPYHLLVVGEFYVPHSNYGERLTRLHSSGRLTLVDRYVANEEVGLYFSAADLLMVPYLTATQSGVVQIAYGFGKPVVATRVGGIPEVVIDGETGYLVPPGDGEALAAAVRRYFSGTDADAFRRNIARENDKYSWDRMVETIEALAADLGGR